MTDGTSSACNSREYWENRFETNWEKLSGPQRTSFYAELLHGRLPEWFIKDVREHQMSVCDWGCAEGEAVAYFSQIFNDLPIVGVDFAQNAVNHAQKKYPAHKFLHQDWLVEGFKAPQFDVIMTSHVLEHFAEPIRILRTVLGEAAKKHIVILVPFNENLARQDPEHRFRFLKHNVPMGWDDWQCTYFEIIDTARLSNTRYNGEQAVIIYTRRAWIKKSNIDLTLANYPMETAAQAARMEAAEQQAADFNQKKTLVESRLETQLLHDQILLKSNNRLQEQNDSMHAEIQKAAEQRSALEQERTELEAELKEAIAREEELARRAEELAGAVQAAQGGLDALRQENETLKADVADAEERCTALQEVIAENEAAQARESESQRGQLAEAARQLEQERARVAAVEADKTVLAQETAALREQGSETARQLEQERARTAALESEKNTLAQEAAKLKEQCAQAVQQRNLMQAQRNDLAEQRIQEQNALQEQIDDLGREKEELAGECGRLQARLEEREAQIAGEREALRNAVEDLGRQLEARGNENAGLAASLEERQAEVAELSERIDSLSEVCQTLDTEKNLAEARAREINAQLEVARALGDEVSTLLAQANEDRAALNGRVAELEQAGRQKAGEAEELAFQKTELEEECAALHELFDESARLNEKLQAENAHSQQAIVRLNGDLEEMIQQGLDLVEQNTHLEGRISELQEQFRQAARERAELQERHEGVQNQLAQSQQELQGLRSIHAQLLQQYAQLQRQNDQVQRRAARVQERSDEVERNAAELAGQLAHLEAEHDILSQSYAREQAECARLRDDAGQLRSDLEHLETSHRELREQHETLTTSHEALLQDKQKLDGIVNELQRRSTEHWERAEQLHEDKAALEKENADLLERGRQAQDALERMEEEKLRAAEAGARLAAANAEQEEALEEAAREKAGLEARQEELEEQLDQAGRDKAQLDSRRAELEKQLDQAGRDKAQLDSRRTELEKQLDQAGRDKAQLDSRRAELEKQLEQSKKDLEQSKKDFEQLRKDKDQAEKAAAAQKRELEEKIARVEEQNRSYLNITEQLQQRIKSLTDNNAAFQVRNRQLQKAVNKLEEERVELDRMSKELSEIKTMYYYRWACKVDRIRVVLGLRSDPKKPRPDRMIEAPGRRLIEDKSAPAAAAAPPKVEPIDTFAVPRRAAASGKPMQQLNVGVVMDKFTMACFEPECTILSFRPDNWESTLQANPIDFLFVESAWAGNGGSWQYRVGTYAAPPGRELDDLLAWCRAKKIPTVFWNKEDPPHFEKFVAAASKFDQVFTTDANCVERYRKHCGHERIDALPFAAQPRIHNPVLTRKRERQTCFAGTYYADTFEMRRHDMEALLHGGAGFGLEIYDRRYGYAGADAKRFAFPDEFQSMIRGRLEYEQMLEAYRWYRVFLNVNSIYDSPTMFSRRVFELLACGTPVVTTPSMGVGLFFGDIVPQVRTTDEVRAALQRLLGDPEQWWQTSARGIRLVMGQHTYSHRMKTICDHIGLNTFTPPPPVMAVVVTPRGDAAEFAECLRNQTEPPEAVIVAGEDHAADAHVARLRKAGLNATRCGMARLETLLREHFGDACIAFMNSQNAYGPEYLRDARYALDYCGKDVTGMSTYYALDGGGTLRLQEAAGEEYFMRDQLLGETIVLRTRRMTASLLGKAVAGGMVKLEEPGYARSRFEFVAGCQEPLAFELSRKVFLKLLD